MPPVRTESQTTCADFRPVRQCFMKGILLFNANVGLEMPTTLAVRATLNAVGVSPISEAILSTRRPMAVSPTYPMERHDVGRIRKTPGRRPRALYAMPALRRDVKLGGSLTSCRSQAATEHSLFRIDKDVSRAFVPPDARPNSKQQYRAGRKHVLPTWFLRKRRNEVHLKSLIGEA